LITELAVTFQLILPRLELHGHIFFRHLKCPHRRADAIQEMVALAWKWYVRLAQRGKDVSDFVAAFVSYAAVAVKSGRRLCGQEKSKDVLSPVAQGWQGFCVERLPDVNTLSANPFA